MVFELKRVSLARKTNSVPTNQAKLSEEIQRRSSNEAARRETGGTEETQKATPPCRQCARVRLRPLRVQGGARTIHANYPSDWFYGINAK